jgi:LPXTG-site transpeptidase (sortase) family protein
LEPLSLENEVPTQTVTNEVPVERNAPEAPVRIVVKTVDVDEVIILPQSTDVDVLDQYLLRGAVQYPNTQMLGVEDTVLLFGHSSYLPVVRNQAYKAFNGIQKLKTGEEISIYSATTEYRYKVQSVRVADASEDVVELPDNGKFLALVTCDSFGKKTNRFVVTANFVGSYAL